MKMLRFDTPFVLRIENGEIERNVPTGYYSTRNVNKENFIAKMQIKYFQSGHFSWVGWLRASKHIFNLGPIVYRTT
jgi:hypothetical protein